MVEPVNNAVCRGANGTTVQLEKEGRDGLWQYQTRGKGSREAGESSKNGSGGGSRQQQRRGAGAEECGVVDADLSR
uniref:Uncharacterized protein n=1 Tax=Globodera rostochiensis TaxID=31243 RepID=A0A914H6V5_GLORO